MNQSTVEKLQKYIEAEIGDSILYRSLAKISPNDEDRMLLTEMADDEAAHADAFQIIYKAMTGKNWDPDVPAPEIKGNYYDILRDRVLDESNDFRKYSEQTQTDMQNLALRDAYYRALTDENVHALRLLQILSA